MWIETKRLAVEGLQPPAPPLRPQEARYGKMMQNDATTTVLYRRLAFAVGRMHGKSRWFQVLFGAVQGEDRGSNLRPGNDNYVFMFGHVSKHFETLCS